MHYNYKVTGNRSSRRAERGVGVATEPCRELRSRAVGLPVRAVDRCVRSGILPFRALSRPEEGDQGEARPERDGSALEMAKSRGVHSGLRRGPVTLRTAEERTDGGVQPQHPVERNGTTGNLCEWSHRVTGRPRRA